LKDGVEGSESPAGPEFCVQTSSRFPAIERSSKLCRGRHHAEGAPLTRVRLLHPQEAEGEMTGLQAGGPNLGKGGCLGERQFFLD
jgi:hypothetical protein